MAVNTIAERALMEMLEEEESHGRMLAVRNSPVARTAQRRAARGELANPFHGLYCDPETWSGLNATGRALMAIRTLARVHPSWVFCSFSAALIHGLYVARRDAVTVHVLSGSTRQERGIRIHNRADRTFTVIDGIKVTPLMETAFQCMRVLPFRRALGVADSTLRASTMTAEEVAKKLRESRRGCRGINYALQVLPHANARSENGGESYARAIMIEQGVQLPDLQVTFHMHGTNESYRADYHWRHYVHGMCRRTIGELDGFDKLIDPAMTGGRDAVSVLRSERNRESRLRSLGIDVVRFTFDDVVRVDPLMRILDMAGIPRGLQPEHPVPTAWRAREAL